MIKRMILLGASFDFTSRLLIPAISELAAGGLLPPGLTVVAAATEDFRQHIANERAGWTLTIPSARAVVQGREQWH